jgi:hypothetical protein
MPTCHAIADCTSRLYRGCPRRLCRGLAHRPAQCPRPPHQRPPRHRAESPEREPNEELALLRDEQLSKIPALDTLLRRSARVSAIQEALLQAGMKFRAGNFLMLVRALRCSRRPRGHASTKNPAIGWAALIIGGFPSLFLVSYRRQKRFEKFEELFPEAIDTWPAPSAPVTPSPPPSK